jgi:DNA polymerase epsilon subunit 1
MILAYISIPPALNQVEAYQGDIIMPNRHEDAHGTTYQGHVLAAETYVGGHVEALEAGVFRSDIPTNFKIVPEAIQGVRSSIRHDPW